MPVFNRLEELKIWSQNSIFLWGPRQTGKSTLLKKLFKDSPYYDLLLSEEYHRLLSNPKLIRDECIYQNLSGENQKSPVIIDEVQKIPDLLDEVHWLIENRNIKFILCGSSARKLKRGQANLLGGRALRRRLFPLVSSEINDFSLLRALNNGLLPPHYNNPLGPQKLEAYVGDYLQEEILAEALTRNIGVFSRFLEMAALSNGEIINYQNIARECGISSPTVKEYYQILEDTLIGYYLPAYTKRVKRRVIQAPKFYFFDIGIVNALCHRNEILPRSELFGRAFEQFIFMEIQAQRHYSGLKFPFYYWRSVSGIEVDFILGDMKTVLKVKAAEIITAGHLKGIRSFKEENKAGSYIVVSLEKNPRITEDGITILPWEVFLEKLWGNELV